MIGSCCAHCKTLMPRGNIWWLQAWYCFANEASTSGTLITVTRPPSLPAIVATDTRRDFSCWDQYLAMAFAQLTYRESLRDIEACLGAHAGGKLYHMGFRGQRGALDAGRRQRIARLAHLRRLRADVLIAIARPLYARDPIGVDLEQSLYALDSTTIDYAWRCFRGRSFGGSKAAVKMHTLLDLHGNIPTFIRITNGNVHDVNILDEILPEAGAFYVMDRGYIDFERLYRLHAQLGLLRRAHQVECACSNAATRIRWTRARACARIRR